MSLGNAGTITTPPSVRRILHPERAQRRFTVTMRTRQISPRSGGRSLRPPGLREAIFSHSELAKTRPITSLRCARSRLLARSFKTLAGRSAYFRSVAAFSRMAGRPPQRVRIFNVAKGVLLATSIVLVIR
jgi:hypothetical protein